MLFEFTKTNIYDKMDMTKAFEVIVVFILYIFVILLLLAAVFLPLERIVLKRVIFATKLRKICDKNNIKFKVINKFYAFSKNTNDKFDFLMRIGDTVFPIKYYSAKNKDSIFIITSKGKGLVRQERIDPFCRGDNKKTKIVDRAVKIPEMKIRSDMIGKKFGCEPIFLNEPSYSGIMIKNRDNMFDVSKINYRVGPYLWLNKYEFVSMINDMIA